MSIVAPSAPKTGTAAAPAPTASSGGNAQNVVAAPFMRGTRKQSTNVTTILTPQLSAVQVPLANLQIRPSGFLARLKVIIAATTSANAATVAFQADAPWNILQNISLSSPGGDPLFSPIDGFGLFECDKLGSFASGYIDPLTFPSYSRVVGAGGTGGSFNIELDIPIEVDSRDAFGVLQNMDASQQFTVTLILNSSAQIYSTAPTTLPTVTITVTMEYYSEPASNGGAQAITPYGNGSLSLIQSQTVAVTPGSVGRIQCVNVGTVIRGVIFILRTSAGVRTEADWPAILSIYYNNQQLLYKPLPIWRNQINTEYKLTGAPGVTPVALAPDNGVLVLTDFMNSGSQGGQNVDGASNRNQWLPTGKGTDLEIEATTAWGASAATLQIITLGVKPVSAQALYAPEIW